MNRARRLAASLHVLLATLPLISTAAETPAAEPLGRLFFSPERRQMLDRQRALNIQESQQIEDPTVTVNGVVRRSSGPQTAWINGVPQSNRGSGSIWSPSPAGSAARLRLTPPGETTRDVSVGETVYRGSGDVTSPLHGGRISVNPAGARPRQ